MKNSFNMKSNLYTRLSALTLAVVMMACSATTPEDDKQSRLDKLKTEKANIEKEIKNLEAEIAKATPDSAKATNKAKAKEVTVTDLAPRSFNHYVQTQASVDAED